MRGQHSTIIAMQTFEAIYQNIWDTMALKAIDGIVPVNLTGESVRMMNQFSNLVSKNRIKAGDIKAVHEHLETVKENYLQGSVGALNQYGYGSQPSFQGNCQKVKVQKPKI